MDSVDYTRMTADDNPDPGADQAERIVKALRRIPGLEYLPIWSDPQKLKRFTDETRMALSGYDTTKEEDARLRQETPEEEPFSSDKFWSNPEELKRAGQMVRPPKL
jgi:hypothetical protein